MVLTKMEKRDFNRATMYAIDEDNWFFIGWENEDVFLYSFLGCE